MILKLIERRNLLRSFAFGRLRFVAFGFRRGVCLLRGGSFATRSRLAHNRYRNFYTARRTDPFVCPIKSCRARSR